MSAPLIRIADLGKEFEGGDAPLAVLRGITLEVFAGEFVAIMGPSGSGKSTLMNLLGLLDQPTSGRYLLAGEDVATLDPDARARLRSRSVGFVFQTFNLLGRASAFENVELPLIYGGTPKPERHRRCAAALDAVALGHRRDHAQGRLSGGEQQRVAIARALVNDPLLILADEPTGALDSATGAEIMALFRALNDAGRTIVLVTHDPEVARQANRIVSMQDGKVIRDEAVAKPAPRIAAPRPDAGAAAAPPPAWAASENIRVALRAITANALRSALTMLGIVIGVAAVIAMVAIGSGAHKQVAEQIRALGANLLLVQPGALRTGAVRLGAGSGLSLTEADADAIAREIGVARAVAPSIARNAQVVRGNLNWATLVGGVTPEYVIARDWRIDKGRLFTFEEIESAAKVVVLGATVADKLFAEEDPLGRQVRIANAPFTVIGVLDEKGQNAASGRDQDDVALIPLAAAKLRVLGGRSEANREAVDFILVKVAAAGAMAFAKDEIGKLLRQRHRLAPDTADDFEIREPAATMHAQAAAARSLTVLLAAVASVSLIVGGISIMNIMLVSVTERTREIGLRQAVGARRRDVRNQFLTEAIILCLLGGLAGIALGSAAAVAIARLAGWPVDVSPLAAVVAVAFAAGVGVFFGFYPARQASRLDPIEALRYE